ncbi:MAG TPA: TonB-dependent receptor [Vicinamibacterales bacterium]|nr:TonB-dependent receptor [Vicinamibacterales bacterium]
MKRLVLIGLSGLCAVILTTPALAQVYTGRIDVTIKDSTGSTLPGVTVEAVGTQTATAVTDTQGEAHFVNLAPGRYTVTAKLSGFADYRNENVPVNAGSIVALPVTLSVGGLAEKVDVISETPVIETKRQTVATNVNLDELQNIPTARDPWVVLQTVPGIVVDRVNVGGAESGQQSNYQAKGANPDQNTWNMDGISITDMGSLGASPTYYDFDMFQEMQVTTGGADPANATPGVQLNFVLRSGTSKWRGSTRYYFENNSLQSDNVDPDLVGEIASYNRVGEYKDWGFEGGGPVIANKVFAWGAYGKTEPEMKIFSFDDDLNAYTQTARDATILENISAKGTVEVSQKTRGNFTYFRGNKQKFGRGASGFRPDETTFNQDGPTDLYKLELNQTVGSSLFLVGRYAHTKNGFSLEPRGGRDTQSYRDDSNVYHGSYYHYQTLRPQDNVSLEGNMFKSRHDLKFGFGWRKASVTSESGWPGNGVRTYHRGYPNMQARVVRDWALEGEGVYWNGYVGDTISLDRLTLNLGVRWDRAASSVLAASVPASPALPDLLPALTAPAVKDALVFNVFTPRLGFTYALNESRKTIVRGSYAQFASQLDSNRAALTVSQIPYYSYVYYAAVDTNGNRIADVNEFTRFQGVAGFDPDNPLGGNPDRIGDYSAPRTHELLFGVEHELFRNFGLSANVTWRRYTGFNWLNYPGVTSADFTQAGVFSGTAPGVGAYNVPYYHVNEDALPADFGQVFETRSDYYQRYLGFEVAATKRMADRWMMRLGFSTNSHREYLKGPGAVEDPTPVFTTTDAYPNVDGGEVMVPSTGSGKSSIYMALPKYQFIANGAYQAKWGITFAANYMMRQGFSAPYFILSDADGAGDAIAPEKNVILVADVGKSRLPAVHSFDGRISKNFTYRRASINVDMDVFNLFNAATVLGRDYDLASDGFDQVQEIMNPRIIRFGVRFGF